MVYGLLGRLESNQVWDTITKEVVGINAPKIAFTRTWDERLDVATAEIGNTVSAFGIGYLANQGLKAAFKKAQREGAGQIEKRWAELARSGGMFSTIFALMWAIPFIRNYMTTRRTGTVKFTDVIGAGQRDQGGRESREVKQALSEYKRKALLILSLGGAAVLACVAGGRLAIAKKLFLGPLNLLFRPWVRQNLLLKDGEFGDFGGLKALLFWGVPCYAGCIQASRDKTEKREQLIKFVNFVIGFSGISFVLKSLFKRRFSQLKHLNSVGGSAVKMEYNAIKKAIAESEKASLAVQNELKMAMKIWKRSAVMTLGASLVALGALPQLLNIYLTRKKLQRQAMLERKAAPALPSGQLLHKNFAEWGHSHSPASPFQ